MKFNSPIPQSLPKECTKAAKIFQSFVDSANNGLDGVIPREIIEQAKGFAIFSVFKAGFLFSARAGSGVVIARLDNGGWSAPSAIGTAGLGFGSQVGAEVTDFLIILNTRSALRSFMAAGSLTLGGNMSIALGPLGRNGEAIGSVNSKGKMAAMYSYSKTRGLFGGLSLEGSVILDREDANYQAYGTSVSAKQLLSGAIEPPSWSKALIQTLEARTGLPGNRPWVHDRSLSDFGAGYAFDGISSGNTTPSTPSYLRKKRKEQQKTAFPPDSWNDTADDYFGSTSSSNSRGAPANSSRSTPVTAMSTSLSMPVSTRYESTRAPWDTPDPTATSSFETRFASDFVPEDQGRRHPHLTNKPKEDLLGDDYSPPPSPPITLNGGSSNGYGTSNGYTGNGSNTHFRSQSSPNPFAPKLDPFDDLTDYAPRQNTYTGVSSASPTSPKTHIAPKPELTRPLMPGEGVARAVALYNFDAVESGDLSFAKGDVITVTKKSESTDDWWKGRSKGKEGNFPANFVEIV
ncbi:hypothetical protein BD626DRAFT_498998 [Schizophyllum amplum]|uniref:SH3 domain-containing protein n=1 Tax=Schizophyllum amplum TaxID=97359 RepID=A0A550CC41_9AGAR|nr:hypothetical protein BD626DRAFT_498998 [Auriculariopsis ampla]